MSLIGLHTPSPPVQNLKPNYFNMHWTPSKTRTPSRSSIHVYAVLTGGQTQPPLALVAPTRKKKKPQKGAVQIL